VALLRFAETTPQYDKKNLGSFPFGAGLFSELIY
jgi:hypothetical protein